MRADAFARQRTQSSNVEIEGFVLRGWPGGWQPDKGETQVGPDEIPDILNMEFTDAAGLRKRKGYNIISDNNTGQKEITSVHRGTHTGGTFDFGFNWPNDLSNSVTLDWDATAAEFKAALEALVDINTVTVTGVGTSGNPWIITWDDPVMGLITTLDGTNLTGGSGHAIATTQQGLSALDTAGIVLIKHVEIAAEDYPEFQQVIFYINESDGHIFDQSLGNIVIDWDSETGSDLQRSGYAVGPWVGSNGPRPYTVQAVTFGDDIYITSQRVGGTKSSGTAMYTHDGTMTTTTNPLKYNATNDIWTELAPHRLRGGTTGFPSARSVISQYDTIFAANVVRQVNDADGDYRWRSRIYWSTPGTAETWESTAFVTVGSDDDGTDITSLTPFRESIMVLKTDSVWTLTGTDTDTFALYSLSSEFGSEATAAAVADEKYFYFFDSTSGVVTYDGANFVNISEPINDELLGSLNRTCTFKVNMWIDERRVYVSIPVGDFSASRLDHNTQTYVYDTVLKVWTQYDIGFVPFVTQDRLDTVVDNANAVLFDGTYYGGGMDNKVGLARMFTTDSDGVDAIPAYFETAWLNPGDYGDRHRIRRLELTTTPDGDEIDVSVYRDLDSTNAWSTATFTPTGTLDAWHEQEGHDIGFWTWIKFKFGNDDANETFGVESVGLTASVRKLLRGVRPELNESQA